MGSDAVLKNLLGNNGSITVLPLLARQEYEFMPYKSSKLNNELYICYCFPK